MRSLRMESSAGQVQVRSSRVVPGPGSAIQHSPQLSNFPTVPPAALAVMFLLITAAVVLFTPFVPSQRFGYDEADYMYAAAKGFSANYLDEGSISAVTFLQRGFAGLHSSNWSALSEYIRRADDVTFYRHFHGPLYFYSILISDRFFAVHERSQRLLNFAYLLLSGVILFVGSLYLVPEQAGLAACLSAFFLLVSPNNLNTAMWLGPHTLYAATSLVALFFMAKLIETNRVAYLYASVAALALAFLTIEYSALLLVTLAIVLVVRRKVLFRGCATKDVVRTLAKCMGLFLLTIAVLWPAAILKLTLAKNYLFFLYFAAVRSATSYGADSLARVWWLRMRGSPLEFTCLLIFVGLLVASLIRKNIRLLVLPFAIYALLVFLTTVRNRSLSPVYISSLLPPLYFIGAVLLAGLVKTRRLAAYALMLIVVAAFSVNGYLYTYRPLSQLRPEPRANGVVEVMERAGVRHRRILVPHDSLPTAHYYFPSNEYTTYPEALTIDQLLRAAPRADGLVYDGPDFEELRRKLRENSYPASNILSSSDPGRVISYVPLR